MNDIHKKQDFLHEEIVEKDYDQTNFINFCLSKKDDGDDLLNWTLSELKAVVNEFQLKNRKNQSFEKSNNNANSFNNKNKNNSNDKNKKSDISENKKLNDELNDYKKENKKLKENINDYKKENKELNDELNNYKKIRKN